MLFDKFYAVKVGSFIFFSFLCTTMKRLYLFIYVSTLLVMRAAAYDFEAGGICYSVTSADEVAVEAGEQPYADYFTLPATVTSDGRTYQVTAIGDNAFQRTPSLVGVILPETLRSIGHSAFANCAFLSDVTLPPSLQTIGEAAFYGCISLFELTIPASVTSIGDEAFGRCTRLSAFHVAEDNADYASVEGVLMDKQHTRLIAYPNLHADDYTVPSGVQSIDSWAFLGCQRLTAVTLPRSLQTIGNAAFQGCSLLQTVRVPDGVTEIGVWAFSECEQLTAVNLGTAVETIGEGAFSFCPQLRSFRVSASNTHFTTINDVLFTKDEQTLVAFPGAKDGSYRIPSTVTTIATQAFFGCNALESVTLSQALSTLGENPFVFCDNLTEVLVTANHPNFVSNAGVLLNKDQSAIVYYPNAKRGAYTVPESIKTLQHGPFMRSRLLTSLTIPTGVESVGDWTFMECDGLQSVTLPMSLTSLGDRAFDCPSLETVFCSAQPMTTTAFAGNHFGQTTLFMPKGSEDSFYRTEGWDVFGAYQTFGLYSKDRTVVVGDTCRLAVYTAGPLPVGEVQLNVSLPQMLKMLPGEDGGFRVALADVLEGTIACSQLLDTQYRIVIKCDDRRELSGDDDPLFFMDVTCLDATHDGVYDMMLQSVGFSFQTDIHEGFVMQPDMLTGINVMGTTGFKEMTGITQLVADPVPNDIYNVQGMLVRRAGDSLSRLPAGIYVINGRKVLIAR